MSLDLPRAFVLGAGLGKRLRPLTEAVPKPMVPVFQKPLITFAFDHVRAALGIRQIIVNTHHRPESYTERFAGQRYEDITLTFRFEPELLETGGGIKNIEDLLKGQEEPLLVYNGDILTDLPLGKLLEHHLALGRPAATLALRQGGGPQQISFDEGSGQVIDIRGRLQPGREGNALFSGLYLVEPRFIKDELRAGEIESVVEAFLRVIENGRDSIGGVFLDEGQWWDLGTREQYTGVHRELPAIAFPSTYKASPPGWKKPVHENALIHPTAQLHGSCIIGAGAQIGERAVLADTIVWPGAEVAAEAQLNDCIVTGRHLVSGQHAGRDL